MSGTKLLVADNTEDTNLEFHTLNYKVCYKVTKVANLQH